MIVDAVGVTESEKSLSKPLDRQPSLPLEKILNTVAAGAVSDDIVSTLASRLARLERELDDASKDEISKESGGKGPSGPHRKPPAADEESAATSPAVKE